MTSGSPTSPAFVRVAVRTSTGGEYPVLIGPGALRELPHLLKERVGAFRYALVADDRVLELHGSAVAEVVRDGGMELTDFSFPEGEVRKNRDEWSRLSDELLEAGFGRDSCVIALGGGVTGDLAGFVAATYMRGLPVVQVPTSIVAMVDSSVGGKTGVDVPGGKNLVGAFHPPAFVLADTRLARTLPRGERSQGLAEAVKHGAILDAEYLLGMERDAGALLGGEEGITAEMVTRSVELKADVVSRDERESGLREILNFGHTLGHAIEASSGYRIPHGSAISMGMVMEARLGERLGVTAAGTSGRLRRVLEAMDLPTAPGDPLPEEEILGYLGRDKKARGGTPRFVLLEEPGRVAQNESGVWSRPVSSDLVAEVVRGAGSDPI
ncbi:MAG: 3-dehydroquinate synthase [Gemmatimonadota bacterium]